MKQHPVPQNVTSYQFRLIGEMTLKQFLELAAGLVIAYLAFNLKLPSIIKWPIVVFSALFGFSLAFLPIQERPLDQWIINFIKSIYSPTRYIWRKQNQPPKYLTEPLKIKKNANAATLALDKNKIQEYLQTLPQKQVTTTTISLPVEKNEQNKLNQISQLLKTTPIKPKAAQSVSKNPPNPTMASTTTQATKQTASIPAPTPTVPEQIKKPVIESAPPLTPPLVVNSKVKVKQKLKPAVVAMYSDQLAMPQPSPTPNILVGMVVDTQNRILPNALIEIQNQQGITVRAIKTNKLGQFFISNPLENGQYKISTEHDNFQFDIIELKAGGKIIPPIKIKAKK
jgi:hypothetical protein